jgi:8-oxo-dGTP diphosphatase
MMLERDMSGVWGRRNPAEVPFERANRRSSAALVWRWACDHRAVPVVCSLTQLDACPRTVAGVLRDARMVAAALGRERHRFAAARPLLVNGDEVRIDAYVAAGVRVPLRTVVTAVSLGGIASVLRSGPLKRLEHVVSIATDGSLTAVHDEVRWAVPCGWAVDPLLLRARMRGLLAARAQEFTTRVAALASQPVIVATAILRDGQVLAARRTRPSALAGRWELPGGRVEPGEAEAAAVVRECREELGAEVLPAGRLGTDLPIDAGVLRVHVAPLAPGSPEPRALEHGALRWLGRAQLDTVDWVDADRAVLADLAALLR